MKTYHTSALLGALALLSPLASGQISGAVDSATSAAQRPLPSVPLTPATSAATQGAASSAVATRAGSAAVDGAVNTSVTADRAANVSASANAANNASVRASGLDVASVARTQASTSLDVSQTAQQIRGATHTTRDTVLGEVDRKIDASERAVGELRRSARQLKGEARSRFNAAMDDVRAKEKALKSTLKDVRKAKSELTGDAQAKLAADYEAYGQAIANAEAAASSGASVEAKPQS